MGLWTTFRPSVQCVGGDWAVIGCETYECSREEGKEKELLSLLFGVMMMMVRVLSLMNSIELRRAKGYSE